MTGQAPKKPDEMIGRTLLGRYRIVRRLAEGGMGVVYLARAEGAAGFLKPVVIKLILPTFSTSREFLGMFVREAQILAQLRHPGIVDVIEFGEQDGAYVMVLEYVAGYNLAQWTRYLTLKQRRVPTEIAIQIVIGVLDALHHVHTQAQPDGTPLRITHRDVSPANILLNSDGYAKLVDFGVARMDADTLFRTEGGGFRGKLPYSAPELFQGGDPSPHADVYSCGVVLHELLIGKNVFAGRTQADTMARVINHAPDSVHGVRDDAPDDIDSILAHALSKSPDSRFASAADFAHALQRTQRASEPELRAQLARVLRADFGDEMAELLGIETLSRRDRAWRRFSLAPPAPTSAAPSGGDIQIEFVSTSVHDEPTRVLDGPPDAQSLRVDQVIAEAGEALPHGPESPPPAYGEPAPRARWLPWTVGALGVALAAMALVWSRREAPQQIVLVESPLAAPAATSTARPPQQVAGEQDKAQPVPGGASEPVAAPAADLAPRAQEAATSITPTPVDAGASAADGTAARAAARRREGPDPAALTRAFRRREKSVEACFSEHGADLARGRAVEIRFDVDAAGRVQGAAVLPEALDPTPLGACLRKVALGTRFPSRGEDVSFRIPVTARRVRVGQ